jgi:hypothetical protein
MMKDDRNQPDRVDDEQTDLDDPLGIARQPPAPAAKDPLPESDDEASVRRRRARAGLDGHDDRPLPGMGDVNVDPDGAAGIDMGYGGEGTDIKRSR